MNMSSWSIRNPVPVLLVFMLLSVFGLIGFGKLQIQDFPDMDLPTVQVTASLEGAAPRAIWSSKNSTMPSSRRAFRAFSSLGFERLSR